MLGLKLPTDPRWVNIVEKNIEQILVDHAYCEQKAASTAALKRNGIQHSNVNIHWIALSKLSYINTIDPFFWEYQFWKSEIGL